MKSKRETRLRRAAKTRIQIKKNRNQRKRLVVHRTPQHIYAQLIDDLKDGSRVLASYSTVQARDLKGDKTERAKVVGKKIAELGIAAGVKEVAFDRSGFKYHGRVKALADAAREAGLNF